MDRRHFLKSFALAPAALAFLPRLASVAAAPGPDGFTVLRAMPGEAALRGGEGRTTPVWGYNGAVPGPEIRVRRGETVRVRLVNELDQPTMIHWHGIRIDNAMDGTELTQRPVAPGESFDYVFTVPDAGTFWYHTHNRSWEQQARGLYGSLIVTGDAQGFAQDLTLAVDDWRLDSDGTIHEASFGALMDWAHAGRLGNWVTVNGTDRPRFEIAVGRPSRIRLINTANARIFSFRLPDLGARLAGYDGQVFADAEPLDDRLLLMPAQRADIIVTPREAGTFALTAWDGERYVPIAELEATGAADGPGADPVLIPNALPEPDLGSALAVEIAMEGGAMGTMAGARMGRGGMTGGGTMGGGMMGGGMMDGDMMDLGELAGQGLVWALNGVAGMPEEPLFSVPRGTSVRLSMANRTVWDHGMHVHGHHFRVLTRNGRPERGTPWRDTASMAQQDRVEVAFVADNPGDWLVHCHMAEHMAGGMMTWFRVT